MRLERTFQRAANHLVASAIDNLGLPRFGGELRAWDQGVGLDVILSSCFEPFFGSAPGGAILPSRPARWCGCRAQRRSRTAPSWGRPEGLSLPGASTAAG